MLLRQKISALFLLMMLFQAAASGAPPQQTTNQMSSDNLPKLTWAHYVGWGLNAVKAFDTPNNFGNFYDRTALGKWVGTDTGIYSNTRNQIRSAIEYDVDGFCVDLIASKVYAGAMGRIYRAAEGLPFYVSLCVDGWHESEEEIIENMAKFLTQWGKHPNNAYIDGKPVIFMYKIKNYCHMTY